MKGTELLEYFHKIRAFCTNHTEELSDKEVLSFVEIITDCLNAAVWDRAVTAGDIIIRKPTPVPAPAHTRNTRKTRRR